jgi:transposase
MVECFVRQTRVASHVRVARPGASSTLAEHMPKAHRAHRSPRPGEARTPGRLLAWALTRGAATQAFVAYQLEHKPPPERGYRACLGLRQLAERYGAPRLEAACQRALHFGAPRLQSVASILKTGLDQQPLPALIESPPLPAHEHVRGADYYLYLAAGVSC